MDALERMNRRLAGLDDELFPEPVRSRNIFIVGAPRSGTTLVSQVMAALFDGIGYINNIAATFWNAPAYGVMQAHRFASDRSFSGSSQYGQTGSPNEPHEFGRFWRDRLGYEDMVQKTGHVVDWDALYRSLDQIGSAWERPVFYKVFQLAWHLAEFDQIRRDAKWIFVTRDLADNVHSLMRLAKERGHHWTSAVPARAIAQFNNAEDWQRAAAQIFFFNEWVRKERVAVDTSRQLSINLDALTGNPRKELGEIARFLGQDPDAGRLDSVVAGIDRKPGANSDLASRVQLFVEGLQ